MDLAEQGASIPFAGNEAPTSVGGVGMIPDLSGPIKLAQAPAGGGGDFWDVGQAAAAQGMSLPVDHGFAPQNLNEVVAIDRAGAGGGKVFAYGLATVMLGILGYFAFQMFVNEKDPVQHAEELLAEAKVLVGLEEAPLDEPVAPLKPRKKPKKVAAVMVKTGREPVPGNPYWTLPNKLLGAETELNRTWTTEEEETWRAGLAHKYSYQRWKTVMEVRERKLQGSDAVLWDALQDKKFWTRMYAAVGIAEFNVEISLQSLEGAMAKARSELVADFFERFVRKADAGQLFVMRQAIRLLDEKGRIVVLQGIANSKDPLRDLYLTAATLDPGKRVKRWIRQYLANRPINPDRYNDLLRVVSGEVSGDYLLDGDGTIPDAKVAKGKGGRKAPLKLATEEDLDKELAAFEEGGGDVEFYDENSAEEDEAAADAKSFEYAD